MQNIYQTLYQMIVKDPAFSTEVIRLRRLFHRFPETAWTEVRTTEAIVDYLSQLGYELWQGEAVSGHETGVVAEICCGGQEDDGKENGPLIALRFDIDGLPNQETELAGHKPNKEGFSSEREGFMHACGHDGHIAIGLGCALIFSRIRELLKGRIRLIFQPAEEGCRGARTVVAHGWLDQVDYFLAGHIVPRLYLEDSRFPKTVTDQWDVLPVSGSFATTKLNARFTGKSSHGATPEKGVSVIPAMASAILALNGIPRHSEGATRINVGKMWAGEGRNILASQGEMELEVRGETTALNCYMEERAVAILKGQAQVYGCQVDLDILGPCPSLVSSTDFCGRITRILQEQYDGTLQVPSETGVFRASEDAAVMMEHVKEQGGQAAYLLYSADAVASLHKPDYDFEESVLTRAALIVTSVTACCGRNEK